jgi:hypothetical protein
MTDGCGTRGNGAIILESVAGRVPVKLDSATSAFLHERIK